MKTIPALIGIAVVIGIGVYLYNQESVDNLPGYVKEQVTEVTEEPKTKEQDVITKAQEELERINTELDAKEQELLKEREAIDAELERLRQTRVSFQ